MQWLTVVVAAAAAAEAGCARTLPPEAKHASTEGWPGARCGAANGTSAEVPMPRQGTPETEWTKWVTVAVWAHVARSNTGPSWIFNDTNRQLLLTELQPDVIDWFDGLQIDRGQYFRQHGVAISAGSGFEYDQSFGFSESPEPEREFTYRKFLSSGIQQDENGQPIFQYDWNAYAMTHFASLWHAVHMGGGVPRRATFGDAVTNDNIGVQFTLRQAGWSNVTAVAYLQWARDTNCSNCLPAGDIHPETFVRDTLKALRTSGASAEAIIRDPVMQKLSRFVMEAQTRHWWELGNEAQRVARDRGLPIPAIWGNQAGLWSGQSLHHDNTSGYTRAGSLVVGLGSDVLWTELSGALAGTKNDTATLAYQLLEVSAGSRGRFACRYPTSSQRYYVAAAEAAANNVVLSQMLSATEAPGSATWEVLAAFNQFASNNSWLLTDRRRLSDVGLVYSLPTVMWRVFSTLQLYTAPEYNATTLAKHLTWLSVGSTALDSRHIASSAHIFGVSGIYPDQLDLLSLSVLVFPGVDAVSDAQVATVVAWVRKGGRLVLWGNHTGTKDEYLQDRRTPAFCGVCDECPYCDNATPNSGNGSVTFVSTEAVTEFAGSPDPGKHPVMAQVTALIGQPLLQTNASELIAVSAFAHGSAHNASFLRTVHLVHYSDTPNASTATATLGVRGLQPRASAVFYSPEQPSGIRLNVTTKDDVWSVRLPSFSTYGVLALASPSELAARQRAGLLRRLTNRIAIASRCRGQPARNVSIPSATEVFRVLGQIQGPEAPPVADWVTLHSELDRLVAASTNALEHITQNHVSFEEHTRASIRSDNLPAVARFDFGPPNATIDSGVGWTRVSPDSMCSQGHSNGALGVSACWVRNGSTMWWFEEPSQSTDPEEPVLATGIRSNTSASLVLSGLTPSTEYNLTLLCGSYQNYIDVAYNQVAIEPELVDGMLGDMSESGSWQHRCFSSVSTALGTITLRLGSSNVGPIYQSTYNALFAQSVLHSRAREATDVQRPPKGRHRESRSATPSLSQPSSPPLGAQFVSWLVNGLIVQAAGQPLTPSAEITRRENLDISTAALRRWAVIGPFNEANYSNTQFGPDVGINLSRSYPSYFPNRTEMLQWVSASVNGTLPLVDFRAKLEVQESEMEHGVAYAVVFVRATISTLYNVTLRFSTSQATQIFINGTLAKQKSASSGVQQHDSTFLLETLPLAGWTSILVRSSCFWGDEWALTAGLFKDRTPLNALNIDQLWPLSI